MSQEQRKGNPGPWIGGGPRGSHRPFKWISGKGRGFERKNQTKGERAMAISDEDKFSLLSDIDWDQPIPVIDQQLYHKYNLTPEEINYIESTIKAMD